jgi:hypothetical protein
MSKILYLGLFRFDTKAGRLRVWTARALAHFLKVTTHLRPWLVRCYNVAGLPRTDIALEDTIRATK